LADSVTKAVKIENPTAAPVADFIAASNQVEIWYSTQLSDLSNNGPTSWKWEVISPDGLSNNLYYGSLFMALFTIINGVHFMHNIIESYYTNENKNLKTLPDTEINVFFENVSSDIQKLNEINKLTQFQLPEFIKEDYSEFVDFIKEYYKFLEKSNDPNLIPYNLENYRDIDMKLLSEKPQENVLLIYEPFKFSIYLFIIKYLILL
jgi:hypothetical protein